MRWLIILSFWGFTPLFSQDLLEFSETQIELGNLANEASSFTDVPVYNNSTKRMYILRADAPEDVLIQYSSKTIEPGASEYIRIKYSPKELGRFSRKIRVFTSDRPDATVLEVSGNAQYIEQSKSPACPDFSSVKPKSHQKQAVITSPADAPQREIKTNPQRRFSTIIEVRDKTNQSPIPRARVDIYYTSQDRVKEYTNGEGQIVKDDMPSGSYYLMCDAPGYQPESREVITTIDNKKILILLSPKEAPAPSVKQEALLLKETPHQAPPNPIFVENPGELSRAQYLPNNIVFLIDLSSSMNQRGRLDLVKMALLSLLEPLRDIDRISLVAYSGTARIVLPSTSGVEKGLITDAIQHLQAEGLTAGEKGLDLAYQIAEKNFIKRANNEVFMVTDGAFNVGGDQKTILKEVKQHTKKEIYLSVLGIKPASITEEELKTLASEGRGSYVTISKDEDEAVLLEAIKTHALNKEMRH